MWFTVCIFFSSCNAQKKTKSSAYVKKQGGFFVFLGVFVVKMGENLGDLVKMQDQKHTKQNQKVCKNERQKKNSREKPSR